MLMSCHLITQNGQSCCGGSVSGDTEDMKVLVTIIWKADVRYGMCCDGERSGACSDAAS